jgi:3-deoxy-7-phosphoheptulonate synthase
MHHEATEAQVDEICDRIAQLGYAAHAMPGGQRTAIGVVGNDGPIDTAKFHGLPGVLRAIPVSAAYKQVSLEWRPERTVITLDNGVQIGGDAVVVMAGPCSVETEEQLMTTAKYVAEGGAVILRGGAYKPRSSPYSFQGLGVEGLKLMAKARDTYGLAIITEALDEASADHVAEYTDIIQLGARNMQNFALLKKVGRMGRPVMLKRGPSATIKEWLLAAEYIVNEGNPNVILCERGIRSFDSTTRNVFDVAAMALVRTMTHLPVIGDPSHGTGRRELITPMSRACVAAGADGIIVETHPDPTCALSDGQQALYPEQYAAMMDDLRAIAAPLGRPLASLT